MKSLYNRLIALLKSPDYMPVRLETIALRLHLGSKQRGMLKSFINKLEKKNLLFFDAQKKIHVGRQAPPKGKKKAKMPRLEGVLRIQSAGHGWFFPDEEQEKRVYIAPSHLLTALDGDRVAVGVFAPRNAREYQVHNAKGPSGRVLEVIERHAKRIVGLYLKRGKIAHLQSYESSVPDILLAPLAPSLKVSHGQVVSVVLTQWKNANTLPQGKVVSVLGWPDTPGVDILSVIEKYGLSQDFPEEVIASVAHYPSQPDKQEEDKAENWKGRCVITIDPASARDFDDAIAIEKKNDGSWELAVHIADVSHYVKPNTPLDKEASHRGNSTYLVDRVLPMLPQELSNGLCSLLPEEDRLTLCCHMHISPQGELIKSRFSRAVICSSARLTYEEAQDILDGKDVPFDKEIKDLVKEAWKMAECLRKRRFEKGGLDLSMDEFRVILDEHNEPIDVVKESYSPSHQLIEECMLVANESAARILKNRKTRAIFRVHESPDEGRLEDFAIFAREMGYVVGDLTNPAHIKALLEACEGAIDAQAIKVGLLKSLKQARYSTKPEGHYGLAKGDYCHFTSPIRRYADLIVHRALQKHLINATEASDSLPSNEALQTIAEHISKTERTSAEAESLSKKMKLYAYLASLITLSPPRKLTCVVTQLRPFGCFVEALEIGVKGLVPIEDFPEGRWRFVDGVERFECSDKREIKQGVVLQCRVIHVDNERFTVDFAALSIEQK